MKRKAIAMLMIASMTVALFAGCGSKSDESDSGKVKLTFLDKHPEDEYKGYFEEAIADFEKENPKIHVKMTSVPSAGTVLKTRMLAGDAPDVINIYPQNVDFKEWAKAGYFENMTGKSYLENIKNHYEKNYAV